MGLNIFEELTNKYNRELKDQLRSKCGKEFIDVESIIDGKSSMTFEDIAGNEYAKEIINETFVLPVVLP